MKIVGKVIRGDGIGKKLGFPTANLDISPEQTGLEAAIYFAYTLLEGEKYLSSLTIQKQLGKVEVHLLNYEGEDFYDKELTVEVIEFISKLQKFSSEKKLKKKIAKDLKKIRLLKENKKNGR